MSQMTSDSNQDQEIQERRESVSSLLLQGHTEIEIAKLLGVSRETIVRDVKVIREEAVPWFDNLARDGFAHECKLAIDKLKQCERNLRQLYDEADALDQKLKVTKALEENIIAQTQYLGEGPTLHALNKALRIYGISKVTD